jgi:DNA-binding transcriptional MocR family regulator
MYMNERGGSCFPSLSTLADDTGYHIDTVQDHLRLLAKAGWISKVTTSLGVGRGSRNDYQATLPEGVSAPRSAEPPTVAEGGAAPQPTGVQGPPDDVVTESVKGQSDASHHSRAACDELFQAIVGACGMDYAEMTEPQRKRTAVALAQLRKVGASPDEIHRRAEVYLQKHTSALTPTALSSQWASLRESPPPPTPIAQRSRFQAAMDEVFRPDAVRKSS